MQKTVDAYIEAAPKEARTKLKEIRRIIRAAAPKAEEKISYWMPYYGYYGRLAYFRLAKKTYWALHSSTSHSRAQERIKRLWNFKISYPLSFE
jgi:uncharacterized protein YdhG (YjbR/CyaY superfamily)